MATQRESETRDQGDLAARYGAGTDLLGVVGMLAGPLGQLEQAASKRIPGRIGGPTWASDNQQLQELVEELAPQLGQLAGELAKATASVVKVTPKQPERKQPGPGQVEGKQPPPHPEAAGGKRS